LRRSGAHRRRQRTGIDFVPAAPAAHRLQPCRAARRHDGDGGARLRQRRRQAARSARGQGLLRRRRRAAPVTGMPMARYCIALAIALLAASRATAAPPPPRTMFADANQKEQAVRAALADPAASAVVLKSVHTTIASYEALVRRYPTSG